MKKVVMVVLCLLVAGVLIYRYRAAHGPEPTYKAFAEEMLNRRYDKAAALADGLTAEQLADLGSQERIGAGPQMFQTLFPTRYTIESTESAPDGGVILHATQTILFNPPGTESAMRPAMFAKMKQVATLRKRNHAWRVTDFSNTFVEMDSVSGR